MPVIKRVLPVFVFLFICNVHAARFWMEPQIGYGLSSKFEQGTATGTTDCFGVGIKLFGFFTQSLYLGLSAQYESFNYNVDTSASVQELKASTFSVGPVLGGLIGPWRVWFAPLFSDAHTQTGLTNPGNLDYEAKLTGQGLFVGLSFWLWKNLTIGLEYFWHKYTKSEQTKPMELSGALSEELLVTTTYLNLTTPYEF